MLEKILSLGRTIIPKKLFMLGQPVYHWLLSFAGALIYGFPSRKIKVVGITGTKGKSTTVELVNAILEEAGYTTATLGTIRFKIADTVTPNLFKMTMPGRFFVQKFLRKAVKAKCDWAIIEMTSQGVLQSRHKWIDLDAFIFTNLSPEHIESHGSYEKYRDAKLEIAQQVGRSRKKNTIIVANSDDTEGHRFLACAADIKIPYSIKDAEPFEETQNGYRFVWRNTVIESHIPGKFNLYNMLAAGTFAESQGIAPEIVKKAFEKFTSIRGRVEFVTLQDQKDIQLFDVVVDYAHTPDSLKQFYSIFNKHHTICILGNTGGGRDTWKRPEMAKIAENHCEEVILTNEDPYDEDPQKILDDMAAGIVNKNKLSIILDRREAIKEALSRAYTASKDSQKRSAVLITGKGTDPYIMGPGGRKTLWDDATVVREELKDILQSK